MQIPVKIRPHLVPFLFKEFEGKQASYSSRTAKSVIFLPSSSITSYLYTQLNYKKTTRKQDKFILYLIIDVTSKKTYRGTVFIDKKGVKETLYMDEQQVTDLNNLLEDLFRVSMTSYIEACLECSLSLAKAIRQIMIKYDLEEVGFDEESLRQFFYREKKTPKLFRFQSKSANRVVNYC